MNLTQINENIIHIKKNGQLTLPAKLREFFPWLNQDSLIEATPTTHGLLLQPLKTTGNIKKRTALHKKTAKELLKEFAEMAKNDQSTGMSAVEFIRKDRQSH